MLTLKELLQAVSGEVVRNTPRYRSGEGYVTLATHNGTDFVFTEAGRKLAETLDKPTVEPEPELTPAPRVRRRRTAASE